MTDTGERREADATQRFRRLFLGWLVPLIVPLVLLAAYAAQYDLRKFASTFVLSLLIGLAALVVGALLGFLFGIPRALQNHEDSAEEAGHTTQYIVNTNLEQISDWLTKILVGVGLIQLGHIASQFSRLSTYIGTDIGTGTSGQLIAGADIAFFSIWGFLLGYLLTRTYLTAAFRAFDTLDRVADRAAVKAAQVAASEVEERQEKQDHIDAKAISAASQLLKPNSDGDESPASREKVEEFESLLAKTSPPIREQIFQQMKAQRSDSWDWRDEDARNRSLSRQRHDRTLPIARALVKVTRDDHRFHGELGFALKDKQAPEYDEAIRELNIAMTRARELGDERSMASYSVNRAQARIRMGKELGYSAPWPNLIEIWDDIRRSEAYGGSPRRIARESWIREWRTENPEPRSVGGGLVGSEP